MQGKWKVAFCAVATALEVGSAGWIKKTKFYKFWVYTCNQRLQIILARLRTYPRHGSKEGASFFLSPSRTHITLPGSLWMEDLTSCTRVTYRNESARHLPCGGTIQGSILAGLQGQGRLTPPFRPGRTDPSIPARENVLDDAFSWAKKTMPFSITAQ